MSARVVSILGVLPASQRRYRKEPHKSEHRDGTNLLLYYCLKIAQKLRLCFQRNFSKEQPTKKPITLLPSAIATRCHAPLIWPSQAHTSLKAGAGHQNNEITKITTFDHLPTRTTSTTVFRAQNHIIPLNIAFYKPSIYYLLYYFFKAIFASVICL